MGKSFLKIGFIYSIGQIFSKAVTFLLIPLYTKKLGIEAYGQLALVDALMSFIIPFVIVGVYSGYTRFYQDYEEKDKSLLKNTAINFALIMSVFDIILVLILGKVIAPKILNMPNSHYILILIVVRAILMQLIVLYLREYEIKYEPRISVTINLVNMIASVLLTIFFVVKLKRGIEGIYEAYNIVNVVILIYLMFINRKDYKLILDFQMLKKMLKFSCGFLPSCVAATVLNLSDRYFLEGYKGFSTTGIYSIGYKFGMLIEPIFVGPFNQLFTPLKFNIWKDKDAHDKFRDMFNKYHLIGCFFILSISVFTKFILNLFGMQEYIIAYQIVPLIILSYFIYGKAPFYSLGIEIKNKTYLDSIVMGTGGITNIILNLILIPRYGIYGASIATIISYILMNLLYKILGRKFYFVKYDKIVMIKVYSITGILYLLYSIITMKYNNILLELITATACIILYIVLCILLKVISFDEVKKYVNFIKNKLLKNK